MRVVAFLWSLVHGATTTTITMMKQHVVLQTPPVGYCTLLEQLFPQTSSIDRKLLRFSNNIPPDIFSKETIVPMNRVYRERGGFPQFHMLSRSHYLQFSHSMYASIMEYKEYCAMEDKLAQIVLQYLLDEKNHWLIGIEDPFLIGSLRTYGGRHPIVERTTWITLEPSCFSDMMIVDMDMDPPHL